jgi:putative glutathione S-transferase
MGMLCEGQWRQEDVAAFARNGRNVRFADGFDGWVMERQEAAHPAEKNRYILYCNRTCPWSHRALITRQLKGLVDAVGLVLLEPAMGDEGWWFGTSGEYSDPTMNATYLHELYSAADPHYTGRVSVPILWDKKLQTIVSSDSGSIARMFNNHFDSLARASLVDFYPEYLREEIDELNEYIGDRINDGIYRCLLASGQEDFDIAFDSLFLALDCLEERLSRTRYLLGSVVTEPDWRFFACLLRFDIVYYGLYNCNLRRIVDYPNLWGYTCDLYQTRGVSETVDLGAMKRGYYGIINRRRGDTIIPKGPFVDFNSPHQRHLVGIK